MKGRGLLRANLLKDVERRLKPLGFVRSDQDFRRKHTEDVRQCVSLFFIPRPWGLLVESHASIRYNPVEELIARLDPPDPLISDSEKLERATIGKRLGAKVRGIWVKEWRLKSQTDVPRAAEKIVKYVQKHALPFLDEYSDMRRTLKVLSSDDATADDLMPVDDLRAKRAIALAYLVDSPEAAAKLAQRKLDWLRHRKNNAFEVVQTFTAHLFLDTQVANEPWLHQPRSHRCLR